MTQRPAAPDYVQFYPTLRCRRSCPFCFNRGLAGVDDTPLWAFEQMTAVLAAAGIRTLDLLGGEPTLHPHLPAMVAALAACGMKTTISTSDGGDLTVIERIAASGAGDRCRMGISLNDAIVPGRLRDFLAWRNPMVKSVCTRDWRPTPAVVEHLLRPAAAFHLLFMDVLCRDDLDAGLGFPDYFERLHALRREYPGAAGVYCGGFVPDLEHYPSLGAVRCPAGTTKLSILPDGSVYPCYLLFRRPEFRLGNLLTDSFAAIWSSPALDFFRTFRGNPCPRRACGHHAACHGGCPAVSLLVAGDVGAPDPRCVR